MTTKHYPDIEANPNFPALEQEILAFWQQSNAFQRSVDARPAVKAGENNAYVFYDGPPFANGLPHYGHLLTGYVKDAIARYHTMKGKRVERRFGWDCHGLPAEMGAEKELNISGRAAIQQFGIDKFNAHCRTSVMKYASEWEYYVNRQGRWVDFAGDYKTMDTPFMESVLWAFKQLYDKGLVYESMRVMPYSWAAETPLSNFETKLDNSYRDRDDKAAYVKFKLKEKPAGAPDAENYYIIAWTTTPWTLPANLALAVGNELSYIAYKAGNSVAIMSSSVFLKLLANNQLGNPIPDSKVISPNPNKPYDVDELLKERLIIDKKILTEALYSQYLEEEKLTSQIINCGTWGYLLEIERDFPVAQLTGADLIGLSYEPLFPYFADTKNAFRILDGSSFVTEGDGTGVVHIAPGFGEDDFNLAAKNDVPVVVPVDGRGFYTAEVGDLAGLHVIWDEASNHKNTGNEAVLRKLKDSGALLKQEQYRHSYPHCWRTDTPLIYRALPSWYVEVTKFRDRAAEINQQIHWIPEHVKGGQMDHMLRTAPDWSISRNRFWGTPIPVWRSPSGKIIVCGSIAEIEQLSGQKVEDLHRPFIDNITITRDGETYTRVEDVFDCWFESGSMPFAQLHYPFENKELFEKNFPADFITEYVGQTRGWFNTLIMQSTALFDKAPFKNCICHGVVLDAETGQKYSKRLKNYKDPKEVMDNFGADALRWMMLASPVMRGMDIGVDPEGKFIRDVVRLNIKPLWSAFNFFTLYANADGVKAKHITASENMLDRYILAKAKAAVLRIEASLDGYDTTGATEASTQFFDVLNNWYIRRSRSRFWAEDMSADKQAAYDTLYTVLNLLCLATAPLLPFATEAVYRGLNGGETSVHLQDFPDVSAIDDESNLVIDMDWARDVCNTASAIRNKQNIRNRQPLDSLTIAGNQIARFTQDEPHTITGALYAIIQDEVNVKKICLGTEKFDDVATRKLQINSQVLGKRLPEKMKQILPASKKGEWTRLADGSVEIAGEKLLPTEYTILLEPKPQYKDSAAPLSTNDALVILDLTITPELEAEGRARDLVRMIQQARKDAGLHVADRITLGLDVPSEFKAALATHGDFIAAQTLAVSWAEGSANSTQQMKQELDGAEFIIGISRAA
jgi:isoleucyl-tRNA synthetase